MLTITDIRVQNYKNIDDSGVIPIERVTALVGRNESGKTAFLKALHKFNPATAEPYSPQREFPRDRYTRDFRDASEWPVCTVWFQMGHDIRAELESILNGGEPPTKVSCTRYYDGSMSIDFEPALGDSPLEPTPVIAALDSLASAARRIPSPESEDPDSEQETRRIRTALANWATGWKESLSSHVDLRTDAGIKQLASIQEESESHSSPETADIIEELQEAIAPILAEAKILPSPNKLLI